MALSDSPLKQKLKSIRPRAIASKNSSWSDGQKLEAVQTYLLLGSVRLTASTLKIPEITIKVWRATAWWKDLEAELKLQDELQLSARLKKVVERSMAVVEDRLDKGNFVFDQKTGKLVRVPVNLKDAHKVAVDSITQKNLINGRQTEIANDGQIEQKLLQLAEKFAELATKKINENRTVELVDVMDVKDKNDAVHEES